MAKSAIGEYVHYHAINYEKYGIRRKDKGGSNSNYNFQAYLNTVKKRANTLNTSKGINAKDKQRIENLLTGLFQGKQTGHSNQIAKIQNWVNQQIKQEFENSMGDISKFWESGEILSNLPIGVKSIDTFSEDQSYTTAKVIKEKIEQLRINIQQNTDFSKNINQEQLNKLIQIEKECQNLLPRVSKEIENKVKIGNTNGRDGKWVSSQARVTSTTNIMQQLNELIKIYGAVPNISLQKGRMFELAVYAVLQTLQYNGVKTLNKFLTENIKNVVGDATTKVQIDTTNLANFTMQNINGYTKIGDAYISVKGTQNKTDIQVDYYGEEIKPLYISAKNTKSLNKNIKIVNGQSLLYILQDEESRFVNHYLNVASQHGNNKYVYDFGIRRQNAVKVVQYITAYKAISGDTYGKQDSSAGIFIINRGGKISILNIGEMISKAIKTSRNPNDYFAFDEGDEIFQNFQNNRADTIENRLNNLLNEIHSRKIVAYIKPSAQTL